MQEQDRPNQPDPSRSPYSRSGLLGRGLQRRRCGHANPRMPDLEGGVCVACLFVDRPQLRGPGQNSRYLDRSKSSPINLFLDTAEVDLSDPFFEFIPGVTGRLKSLVIDVEPEELELVSAYLTSHAPLLEVLSIYSSSDPVLPSALFNGDLSSLHELCLGHVHTGLPWRNMVNLTLLTLTYRSPPVSIGQLLDFFESAPHLCEVDIFPTTPISGTRTGRLVPLTCLQRMDTSGHSSSTCSTTC